MPEKEREIKPEQRVTPREATFIRVVNGRRICVTDLGLLFDGRDADRVPYIPTSMNGVYHANGRSSSPRFLKDAKP